MAIQILQDLSLFGGFQFLDNKAAFPENPSVGTIILKEDVIYAYIVVGGLETWYPFSSRTSSYVHTQGLANTTWTITHNLGTSDIWIQAKDSTGRVVSATMTVVDENVVQVNFTSAMTGNAIIVAASSINVPEVKATVVNVGPDVQINTTGVRINGSYALTGANITEQVATIVADETAALQAALSAETTARQSADASKADLVGGKVPASQLPSYVDDVIEAANLAALPGTGETGKIYIAIDTGAVYRWSGSTYIEISAGSVVSVPYDLAGSVFGLPTASESILRIRACRAFTMPSGQSNAQAKSAVAATASATFTLAKNGSSIGTVVFGAGSTTGTITFSNTVSVAVGDLISLTAPAVADSTLADIDFAFIANA